jgi:hypothetical protein
MRSRGRPLLLALLVPALFAGCVTVSPTSSNVPGGTLGSGQTAAPAASRAPDTPLRQELRNVNADGTRSLDSALRLFAMAYGPIPGVDNAPGPGEAIEGTLALRAVKAHYNELTADQKAAVDAALAPDPNAVTVTIPPVSGRTSSQALAVGGGVVSDANLVADDNLPPLEQALQSATDEYRFDIAAKIGDIPGPIKLSFSTKQPIAPDGTKILAATDGIWVNGSYTGCLVEWYPAGINDEVTNTALTIAHEVFHCFQAANLNNAGRYYNAPDWWQEGGAEWVSNVVAGAPVNGGFWGDYVDNPETSLFERTYDATGFWADLNATGIDPWTKWKTIWSAYSNEAAWLASGAEDDTFLNSWASGWFRDPSRGADWDMTGPGIIPGSNVPQALQFFNGGAVEVDAKPYSASDYNVRSDADIVHIVSTGHVRLNDDLIDETMPSGQYFCTKDGGCNCPDGKPPPFPVTNLAPGFVIAVSGGSQGSGGTVSGIKLEDFCKKPDESPNQAVMVHVDRPGSDGVLPGNVVNLVSCNGPYGTWKGVFRTGGLSVDGFNVPFVDLPVEFTMPDVGGTQTATTTTGADVPTPIGNQRVDYVVHATVTGGTMTINLDPSAEELNRLVNLPILPAPEGTCP